MDNPAFLPGNSTDLLPGKTMPGSTFPDPTGEEPGPEDQGSEGGDSGPQGNEGSSSDGQGTGGQGSGDDPGAEPDAEKAAREFCADAAICFPIHEAMPGNSIHDLGPSSLSINFAEPVGTTSIEGPKAPLNRAISLLPTSLGVGSSPLDLKGNNEIAFDIWFSPDQIDAVNWTLFELDNFLALERMATGGLRCALKGGIVNLGPATDPNFSPQVLHHAACGIKDGRVYMWWDQKTVPYAIPSEPPSPTMVQIGLGQGPSKSREPFVGRVAGVRVWNDVETMRVRNNLPAQLNANQ